MQKKALLKELKLIIKRPLSQFTQKNKCINKNQNIWIDYDVDIRECRFGEHGFIAHHAQLYDVNMGEYSSIGRYSKVRSADIGRYCSISWDVTIGAVEPPLTRVSTAALTYKAQYNIVDHDEEYPQKRAIIGNDVWIGCNVVIRSGVKVGDGAVIGAGSVCVKDIPPYAIVAGNPAKLIRMRTDEESVERLLQIKWWNWSTEEIKAHIDLFKADLSKQVIDELEEYSKKR